MIWRMTVEGQPQAQATRRASRFARGGGRIPGMMDTPAAQGYKQLVRDMAGAHKPLRLLEGPLRLRCDLILARPKRLRKGQVWCTTRPDVSNYLKLIEDALTGIVYRDDSQIVTMTASKTYAIPGPPRVFVEVEELEESK